MNPRSGRAGRAVSPAKPRAAEEADDAHPGEAEQGRPHRAPQGAEESERANSWIEIEMVDEEDEPVPGEAYRIELPDGSIAAGTLDENGMARVEGIEPGTCRIMFPELDREAWERA